LESSTTAATSASSSSTATVKTSSPSATATTTQTPTATAAATAAVLLLLVHGRSGAGRHLGRFGFGNVHTFVDKCLEHPGQAVGFWFQRQLGSGRSRSAIAIFHRITRLFPALPGNAAADNVAELLGIRPV